MIRGVRGLLELPENGSGSASRLLMHLGPKLIEISYKTIKQILLKIVLLNKEDFKKNCQAQILILTL